MADDLRAVDFEGVELVWDVDFVDDALDEFDWAFAYVD